MALTERFGLSRVGGAAGGSLTGDGFKYTDQDRRTIDRILNAFETHSHTGGDRLADPAAAPGLVLDSTNGTLAGGITYYYRISYIDRFGLETAASPEVAVATPGQVSSPSRPTLVAQSTGGTLTAGLYSYALTAESGDYETQLGPESIIQLLSDRDAIELTLPALPAGADSFGVWRRGPDDSGFTKIGTTSAATILDDGTVPSDPCACDPDNLPPQENRTNSTNAVVVTVPNPALLQDAASDIARWRIYRATSPGGYGAKSLVAEVTDLDDDGFLVTSYTDLGGTPAQGGPLERSQTLTPSVAISGGGGAGGQLFLGDGVDTWRISVGYDGILNTTKLSSPITDIDEVIALTSPTAGTFLLTIDAGGVLTTTSGTDPEATLYENGAGPHLPSPNGVVTFQLEVTDDGELETHGDVAGPNIDLSRPTVVGSRSDGTALQSLLAALVDLGLVNDLTTA